MPQAKRRKGGSGAGAPVAAAPKAAAPRQGGLNFQPAHSAPAAAAGAEGVGSATALAAPKDSQQQQQPSGPAASTAADAAGKAAVAAAAAAAAEAAATEAEGQPGLLGPQQQCGTGPSDAAAPTLLLFEDVDVLVDSDRGFWAALASIIQESKVSLTAQYCTAEVPLIQRRHLPRQALCCCAQ